MSDSETATTRSPSRRRLIAGGAACALPLPSLAAATDPALAIARQWCWLEAEQHRLVLEWQAVETWLFKNRNWPKLTDDERDVVPEGTQLGVIEAQLDGIDRTYDALLPRLRRTPASTRAGVLAKFDALLWFLDSTDHPDARAILKSCQRDLKRLWV